MKIFEITKQHLALIQKLYIDYEDDGAYFGVITSNAKRPFGNSGNYAIFYDMASILGLETEQSDDYDEQVPTEESAKLCVKLFKELGTVMQICVLLQKFEPGQYIMREKYNSRSWEKLNYEN